MIRDIGQGRHEKRWKSGIVRVRGKAGRGGGGVQNKKNKKNAHTTPPLPRLPATPELFLISFSSHDLVAPDHVSWSSLIGSTT